MPGLPNIPQEIILTAIEKLGPCQPLDIYREVKQGDTVLIGAMLSELVAGGKLLITKIKRGGSPFYYDPNRPERLDGLSKYLNQKDQRTYAMLREQSVMREDTQEPLARVGLQNMPDFSKRVVITLGGEDVVFWRHYLIDDNEAQRIAKGGKPARPVKEEREVTVDEPKEKIKEENMTPDTNAESVSEKVVIEPSEKPAKRRSKKTKNQTELSTEKPSTERSAGAENAEKTIDVESAALSDAEPIIEKPKSMKLEKASKKRALKKAPAPTIMPDGAVMISPQEWLEHDTLYEKVRAFAGGMVLRDARVHKPHSELTCILSIDAPFGKIDMFVHAFNKKFTPEDIKATMPQARELGLPVLILSVDPIPSKVAAAFKGMPNIFFKQFNEHG